VVSPEGEPDEGDEVGDGVAIGMTNVVDLDSRVGVPDQIGRPVVRGPLDALGELAQLDEGHTSRTRLRVQHLQGGDLVPVLVEVATP